MKKLLKTILVLIFVALGAFAFSPRPKANFYAKNATNTDTQKDLYIRNCARCHGADGAGQTDLGKKLDVPDLSISGGKMSVKKISRVIANGKEEMPAFGNKLSKSQIASVAAYVRKL